MLLWRHHIIVAHIGGVASQAVDIRILQVLCILIQARVIATI